MLLWRMRPPNAGGDNRIECHLIRRDMEYRLSIRVGKTVVVLETHRTPTAAAQRAESLRRQAMEGELDTLPTETSTADDDLRADGTGAS
jgi:hypothetical protein